MKSLKIFGLTDNDIQIYRALLKLGESSTGRIIKEARIASSRTYSSLDKLEKEGFVTHILRNNVKFFRSINPDYLIEKAEEKQKEIIGLVPILKSLKTESNNDYATIYEGRNGFKQAFELIIKECSSKDIIYTIGFSDLNYASESLRRFLKSIDRKRIRKRIKMKMILNEKMKNTIGKDRQSEKYTEVKYLSKKFISPTAMNIFKDYVLIEIWRENPLVFLIKNKQVADSFRTYFELLWA